MTRNIFALLLMGLFLTGCQPDGANTNVADKDKTAAKANKKDTQPKQPEASPIIDRLLKSAGNNAESQQIVKGLSTMMSASMIETVTFANGKVSLSYFKNAETFNKSSGNNRATLTQGMFDSYWSNGLRNEKVITSVPASILNEFEFVKSVDIDLSDGKKNMTATITRDDLATLTGKTWMELKEDWTGEYRNVYVRTPEGRAKFFKALVK